MRPLPTLTDLTEQPSVFDQSTDDFNAAFANEFTGTSTQQAVLDQGTPEVLQAMDPISQAIDAIGSALDAAMSVLDLLSGDLDAVNLDPEILNFQAADKALDDSISNFTVSGSTIADGMTNFGTEILKVVNGWLISLAQQLAGAITEAFNLIAELFAIVAGI